MRLSGRNIRVSCKASAIAVLSAAFALSLLSSASFSKPERRMTPLSSSDFHIETRVQPPVFQQSATRSRKLPVEIDRTVIPPPAALSKAPQSNSPTNPFETSFTSWPAKNAPPIAAILSIHGFGLHKESFAGFAKQMAEHGISVYAIDVRGFGSWIGEARDGKKLDFYQTMMDLRSSIYWVKTMNPGVPVFLLGESMGGAIALQATALFPECVSGLIASVPGSQYYGAKKAAMEVALRMVRPNAEFNVGDKVVEKATTDEKLRNNWLNDPRARLKMTPKQMTQFAAFMNQTDDMAKKIESAPVLLLQGKQDKLSKADGTEQLFKALKTPNKSYVLLDNAEHLIFEKGQYGDQTASVVEDWLMKQTQRLKSAGSSNSQ